ncbi:MAG TPA: glucoamylase family protein [Terracidiphilus sp.]|nr:glucoamylase family protein [Terracidiphilus sp.]
MMETNPILEAAAQAGQIEFAERLESVAHIVASWDVLHKPQSAGNCHVRIDAAEAAMAQLEERFAALDDAAQWKDSSDSTIPALLELRAHGRSLRDALAAVSNKKQLIAALPRIVAASGAAEPRVQALAGLCLNVLEGIFSGAKFSVFIQTAQAHDPLTVDELWIMPGFLQFILLESLLDSMRQIDQYSVSAADLRLPERLANLDAIAHMDWTSLIEPLILFDRLLAEDPAGAYMKMDFESRELYRKRIALVARYSDCTEREVVQIALEIARRAALHPVEDARMQRRRIHVGYYLIGSGFPLLAQRAGFHPPVVWRMRSFIRTHGADFYINSILIVSLAILALVLFPALAWFRGIALFLFAVLVLLPLALQNAVELVNQCVTALFDPEPLPKLDFSRGLPADCATLVAVPALLLSEKQVRELVNGIEVRFLANQQENLHFALLTDLPDSLTKPRDRDSHPLVDLAIRLIDELNEKYEAKQRGSFLLLHRHRIFNRRQGVWMGWERKRGKLLDLNQLLAGEYDAFPIKAGRVDRLSGIRYILTLDSDTRLPRGAAARLAGAIAHPLNRAVIDSRRHVVTSGYGILQPRVDILVEPDARSRMASIFSGQTGFDPYSHAASDAYQDLIGEGIFTGKGIYEVAAFHTVLHGRFPRNALLSHDLIEGAYVRAGLASDIAVIDDYPSHYSAYSRRQHRWVRGDWQIAQWLFSRVPNEAGRWVHNPISAISRWKIFDNLRRSIVDPALLVLFVAGWFHMPRGPVYWTIASLCLLSFSSLFPAAVQLGRGILRANSAQCREALQAAGRNLLLVLFRLTLLLHQTFLMLDAILRSLIRRWITGERLLEWETAAQAEMRSLRRMPTDRYLSIMPLAAAALTLSLWFFARPSTLWIAYPILLLWALSGVAASWLGGSPRRRPPLEPAAREFLMEHALRIWRYFHEFGVDRHNHLIPDNVNEETRVEAARVSPTNLGMLLNARQAACELGFLTVPEFAMLTGQTLASLARMKKFHGNLCNWYSTETLAPLDGEPFISSVDSGNFVASLLALHQGIDDLPRRPLFSPQLLAGLRTHFRIMHAEEGGPDTNGPLAPPVASADLHMWNEWFPEAEAALKYAVENGATWWQHETLHRVRALRALFREYLPWVLPEYRERSRQLGLRDLLHGLPSGSMDEGGGSELSLESAIAIARHLHERAVAEKPAATAPDQPAADFQEPFSRAHTNLVALAAKLRAIRQEVGRMIEATDFSSFVHPGRRLLSIGYNPSTEKLHDACYDLLASEARVATFLAIARGDLPQQSWTSLDRAQRQAFGQHLPVSWTGTIFEYLMPGLWMRSGKDSLLAQAESACVEVQRAFARRLHIPWGISESGSAERNEAGDYGYRAFGMPSIALSPEATAGPVVAPYATFLALGIHPGESLDNLRRMQSAGWVGAYGFYEAADYSGSLREPVLVREWMAHHQGMSLLAIANLLRDNIFRKWFHANPIVQTTEMLLNEPPLRRIA